MAGALFILIVFGVLFLRIVRNELELRDKQRINMKQRLDTIFYSLEFKVKVLYTDTHFNGHLLRVDIETQQGCKITFYKGVHKFTRYENGDQVSSNSKDYDIKKYIENFVDMIETQELKQINPVWLFCFLF